MDLSSITAVVTGGGSGLGAATARRLAAAGARVGILDLDGEAAAAVAADIGGVGAACDVADAAGAEAALARLRSDLGPERILVNCAGIGTARRIVGRDGPMPLDAFEAVVRVNLIGSFNMLRLSAAAMTAQDPVDADGERGVVIFTASVAAFEGQLGQGAYAASKAGICGLTLPAARELTPRGVRVVTIAPGLFATPLMDELPPEVQDGLARTIPVGRLGRPEEFAALVQSCIANPFLSGEVIRLDGAMRLPPR